MELLCEKIPAPANDNDLQCLQCGAPFAFKAGKKFCSRKCKKRNQDQRRDRHKNGDEFKCAGCGIVFKRLTNSRNKGKYCSRECAARSKNLVSPENKKLADSLRFRAVSVRCKCVQCGVWFCGSNLNNVICSDECRENRWRALYNVRVVQAANDNRATYICRECNARFSPSYGEKNRVFCSPACLSRSSNRVRRHKERARLRLVTVETVDPNTVFERDGWRCQFCKVKTPRKLRGTYEPNAPELDHIIPLSCGGEHSYRNTQCLCRSCNADKSNNPLGQLRLFG